MYDQTAFIAAVNKIGNKGSLILFSKHYWISKSAYFSTRIATALLGACVDDESISESHGDSVRIFHRLDDVGKLRSSVSVRNTINTT